MVNISEGTFTVNGQELYTKTWLPDGPVRAKLIAIHGFSDHINNYREFFPTLAERGIAVYGFDQRGWGRSVQKPADKGRSGPTATVLADIVAFVKPHLGDETPVFVLGHSMGGNEVATLMAAPAGSPHETDVVSKVRGWLLEAPFFGFPAGEAPSALKISVGRLAGRLLPNFQLKNKIPVAYLSRDKDIRAALEADPLCHDTGTLEGLAALLDRVTEIAQGRVKPGPSVKSIWVGHGDADKCTSFVASKKWFDTSATAVPDRTFRSYEKWVHQLHGEPLADRQLFYREVGDWILERAGGAKEDAAGAAADAPVSAPAADADGAPVVQDAPATEAAAATAAAESKL
ncbi:hypothetical protein HMPREF1624_04602 [Sporothrix schenckii ATCC 58251]|uniref:Serine aminopeptidase S33 domain-containing protein n=1 Tax=Sporothrix schenckii (strain ATCC 58251 / de Perez 2211183) TaxID=1391915 RepID=U7PV13_SPOS1|nr:hypothetical protein HMPREF1624_04602 [Sporothrix schenckii ATCC 58251]